MRPFIQSILVGFDIVILHSQPGSPNHRCGRALGLGNVRLDDEHDIEASTMSEP